MSARTSSINSGQLHDRARESTDTLRKLLLALSTAACAFFFEASLSEDSADPMAFLSVAYGLSAVAATVATFSDISWSFWWANLKECKEQSLDVLTKAHPLRGTTYTITREEVDEKRRQWWRLKYAFDLLALGLFLGSVVLTAVASWW